MSGLGRGLGSLIPNRKVAEEAVSHEHKEFLVEDSDRILNIPVGQIDLNPMQPRQTFDHEQLEELINSIKRYGIIQPLVVTKKDNQFELIAGERRLRSAKILELKTVPCIVREADELEKLELALIENIQRSNLNPIEEALAYEKLINEFNLTQEDVADKVGKSRSTIANMVRVLSLPEAVQKALIDKKITEGHARVIAGFDSEEEQLRFLEQISNYNFTVRDAEKQSRQLRNKTGHRRSFDPETESIKEQLREALSTRVDVRKKAGKGQIIINFYSEEEYNDIIRRIIK